MTEEPISAKGAARIIGTDARTLRKFLRSDAWPYDPVGQGHRYEFTPDDMPRLQRGFEAWDHKQRSKTRVIELEADPGDEDIEELELDDEAI